MNGETPEYWDASSSKLKQLLGMVHAVNKNDPDESPPRTRPLSSEISTCVATVVRYIAVGVSNYGPRGTLALGTQVWVNSPIVSCGVNNFDGHRRQYEAPIGDHTGKRLSREPVHDVIAWQGDI